MLSIVSARYSFKSSLQASHLDGVLSCVRGYVSARYSFKSSLQASHLDGVLSCVRGYHIYKSIWNATLGDTLLCEAEVGNVHDPYAVAVVGPSAGTQTVCTHSKKHLCPLSLLPEKKRQNSLPSDWTQETFKRVDWRYPVRVVIIIHL